MLTKDEQELWHHRAKRLTQHALWHMDSVEIFSELELAIACLHVAANEAESSDLEGVFPGDDDYECPFVYHDCGFEPY